MVVMARLVGLMALILAQAIPGQALSAEVAMAWDTRTPAVRVTGLSAKRLAELRESGQADLARVLQVSVEPANPLAAIGLPQIAGRIVVNASGLEFLPQFPFEPGLSYRAVFQQESASPVTSVLRMPKRDVKPETEVAAIFPTADVLPQNLLKFYLHFSGPMRGGHIYEHIQLADESGRPVELPFLEIDEELWNPEMTRLTLFLDPGRIKREVKPLEEIGPALYPGKAYTLTIKEDWIDARGAPLKSSARKVFKVAPPDRDPPDPARWKFEAPKRSTTAALTVAFGEPMDQALAMRMISIVDETGRPVAGTRELCDFESRWVFEPAEPWQAGAYQVLVQSTIEDLAGNNIGKPFEVDLAEGNRPRNPARTIALPFQIR